MSTIENNSDTICEFCGEHPLAQREDGSLRSMCAVCYAETADKTPALGWSGERGVVNVHSAAFESGSAAADFADRMGHVLRTRHGWWAAVRVVDGENGGQQFSGDVPADWDGSSYDQIWSQGTTDEIKGWISR